MNPLAFLRLIGGLLCLLGAYRLANAGAAAPMVAAVGLLGVFQIVLFFADRRALRG